MRTWMIGAAALLAVSCGGNGAGSSRLEKLRAHTEVLRNDTTAHGDRIAAMGSLDGVPGEEAAHHADVVDHAGEMHDGMDGMMTMCSGDVGSMHDLMGEIEEECAAHHDAMDGAAEMPDAYDEEMRHQAAMDGMLDRMDEMREQMTCGMGGGGMMD